MIQVKLVSKVGRVRGSGRGLPPRFETIPTSEEASICLECPLPTCNKIRCDRYEEEKRKLREKGK